MGLRLGLEGDAPRFEMAGPRVHVVGARYGNADVVEHPLLRGAPAVHGEVVVSPAEVDVVRVGTPLDRVAHGVDPEALGRFQILGVKSDVPDAEHRPAGVTIALQSSTTLQ